MSRQDAVDLRSDTVTRPDAAMRRAMADAVVGDDVYAEDPSVRALEELAAERLGHEAAIFVPSGTMGNQIAIHLHTSPGEEVLVEPDSHVQLYELSAMAAWSGVLPRVLAPRAGERLGSSQLAQAVAAGPYYMARAGLLVLENSHNHAGGVVLELDRQRELIDVARRAGVRTHLDGARIFNAAAALDRPARELAEGFDSVMFCLSKGLGAPVGSLLCGAADLIGEARVVRKRMGGGMRQAGVLAAAGQLALTRNVARLVEDHRRAAELGRALANSRVFELDPTVVQTNIVIARVLPPHDSQGMLRRLGDRGVLAGAMGPGRIRFVTHLDVDDDGLDRAIAVIRALDEV